MAGDCGLNALSLLPENVLPQWQQKIALRAESIRTHRHIMIWSRRIFCEAIFCRYWTCTFSCRNNQAIGPRLSAFSPSFIYRMAMRTKKCRNSHQRIAAGCPTETRTQSNRTKIWCATIQTEPKSGVLPLHHGAIDFNFAFLRAQIYGIILTFPNFSGKIFRICTQFAGKCYVCCSKSLGSPYASMTLMT